jgi:hypothetical protein
MAMNTQPAEAKTTRREMNRKTVTKALDHMEIHHAKNGGHILVHHFHPESHGLDGGGSMMYGGDKEKKLPELHTFGPDQGAEALAHVGEHMEMAEEKPEATPAPKGDPKLEAEENENA